MDRISVKQVFVNTQNVRNFSMLMDGLDRAKGEGRLGLVWGRAGRGKTRTATHWAANKGAIYYRTSRLESPLDFLHGLLFELGEPKNAMPSRKGAAFNQLVDILSASQQTVILDEIERFPGLYLDAVRDLADRSGCAIVLCGEEELYSLVRRPQNRRVWSRMYQSVEFGPIGVADVVIFARESAGVTLNAATATELHKASGGDFRLVRRDLLALCQILEANATLTPTAEMVKSAISMGVRDRRAA